MKRYLDPKSDLTFKRVFGEHKDIMISFLNAMLPLQEDNEVVDIEYLPTELVPEIPTKKDSIVDVRCKDTKGRQFIVEMQMYWTNAFMQRAVFNTCKAYATPVERGQKFREIKPVYTISLINDIAFPDLPDDYYHCYLLTNQKHPDMTINEIEMVFIELPKFKPKGIADKKMMVLWLRFLTEIDEHTREIPEEMANDELLTKALSVLEYSCYSDAEMRYIDRYWDMVSRERTMTSDSEDKGREEGIEIGMEIGMEKGRAEGERKATLATARNLKAIGIPAETIAQVTGLSVEEIERL